MTDTTEFTPWTFPSAHLAWLACLGGLLSESRRAGLLSLEDAIVNAGADSGVFRRFPQVGEVPYFSFATDLLRLMLGGTLDSDDLRVYAEHAVESLTAEDDPNTGKPVDASVLKTIWLTLWASQQGHSPQTALEFGRQAVPVRFKPSFREMETLFAETQDAWRGAAKAEEDLESRIQGFVASLDGQ
jgi:flagellar motor component MotA